MSKILSSIENIRFLDELALKKSVIHRLHPVVKLFTTAVFLAMVVSYDKYELSGLLPYFIYPIILITLTDIPLMPLLKRVFFVEILVLFIGILNPFFDGNTFMIGAVVLSKGWLTFLSIIIKSALSVLAALLFIATTGIDGMAKALRTVKVPKILVLQLLLTYRYIIVLLEEFHSTFVAYSLKAPKQKGIHFKVWGSFAGQLLLRTFDRASRVYTAMCLRGFEGEYHTGKINKIKMSDLTFIFVWIIIFVLFRLFNIVSLIGNFFLPYFNS